MIRVFICKAMTMLENQELLHAIWQRVKDNVPKPAAIATKSFREWLRINTSYLESATVTQRVYHLLNGQEKPTCKMCDKAVTWRDKMHQYSTYCSSKCANSDIEFKQRRIDTVRTRYGVDTIGQSLSVKAKRKATLMDRYGVDNPSTLYVDRSEQSFKSKNRNANNQPHIEQLIADTLTQAEIGEDLGISQPRVSNLLSRLNLSTSSQRSTSVAQLEIEQLCRSAGFDIVINHSKLIPPRHVDIYIPAINLAIEFNGIVWHGESMGRDRRYHLSKTELCAEKGVRLYQIFSSDWAQRRSAVQHRLMYALRQSNKLPAARECSISVIEPLEEGQFLTQYHTQGYVKSAICFGLRDSTGQLNAVMSFCTPRASKRHQWEMLRFATSGSVAGAMSKLFSHFVRTLRPTSVVTYADRRWGDGSAYQKIKFVYSHTSKPNYWYFNRNGDTNKLMSRMTFQKHKLVNLLPTFDEQLTEWENMQANGYDRIWDCGNTCWEWYP